MINADGSQLVSTYTNGLLQRVSTLGTEGSEVSFTSYGDGRLTEIGPIYPDNGGTNNGDLKEDFRYDEQGRMLSRDVYSYDRTSASWVLSSSRHFAWDGWNILRREERWRTNHRLRQGGED